MGKRSKSRSRSKSVMRSSVPLTQVLVGEARETGNKAGEPVSPSNASRIERASHFQWIESKPVPQVTLPWLYESHTNVVLMVVSAAVLLIPFLFEPYATMREGLLKGGYLVTAMFLAVGINAFPHGPFVRPHPVVWRVVFGVSLGYLVMLTSLLMLSADQMREAVNWVDGAVGQAFELPNYAADCSLTWANVVSKMDRFVPAHFFGWLVKGLMIRHRVLLWTFSVGWELLELSMVYAVPNFGECFWDQWIMDVLVCNGLGIEAGLYLCKYLEHKRYKWSGVLEVGTLVAKVKRSALQFTPESWTKVEWESTGTIKRYFQVQVLLILCLIMELNAFLLKLNLFIPTEHPWNLYRMLLVVAIALPSIRQYYLYCVDSRVNRLGSQAVVAVLICFAELSVIIKSLDAAAFHPPKENVYMWLGALFVYVLASVVLLRRRRSNKPKLL